MTDAPVSDERLASVVAHVDWHIARRQNAPLSREGWRDLASLLRELQRLRAGRWQPIETAPKGSGGDLFGPDLILWTGDDVTHGFFHRRYGTWEQGCEGGRLQPEAWHPMPPPPRGKVASVPAEPIDIEREPGDD